MKRRKPTGRAAFLAALVLAAMGGASCRADGPNPEADVRDIAMQWTAIEQNLGQPRPGTAVLGDSPLAEALGAFESTVRAFLDSEAYRMHSAVPPPRDPGFGLPLPDETPSVRDLADLASTLRLAVLDGDQEKAMLASADISGVLVGAMAREAAADRFLVDLHSRLIFIFAAIIAIVVAVVRVLVKILFREIRSGEESSAFSRAVLLAQEAERGRISREIHDTVVQDLRRCFGDMDRIVAVEGKAEREALYSGAAALQALVAGRLRGICDNLVPLDFGSQGLPDALRRLCRDFGERAGIACRLDMAENPDLGFRDMEKQLQVFRIVQEALTNVEKHAGAGEAVVELRREADGTVCVSVCDDGDPGASKPRKGTPGIPQDGGMRLGIRGMNERATLLGGTLSVDHRPGKGTSVLCRIPPPPPPTPPHPPPPPN
ncbi:MAG: ATP-binding protein, partial [Treponema sp.]|nr:ATP-binding protein [Treponema sp.]